MRALPDPAVPVLDQETVDYQRELSKDARERKWPNVVPRDAATLILLDRSGPEPKVLMGRRHPGLKFMPGKYVFPGGRIEPGDRDMHCAGELPEALAPRLLEGPGRPGRAKARALALAAIRETFEETGILLGRRAAATAPLPEGPWRDFAAHGVLPDLSRLHFVARAITPPRRPKRFDTRFFTLDASEIAHRIEGTVGPETELVELVWQNVSETAKLDLPAITHVVLKELTARVAKGMGHALPVPFFRELNWKWRRELL